MVLSPEKIDYWRQRYQELLPEQDPRVARAHEIFKRVLQVAGTPRGTRPVRIWRSDSTVGDATRLQLEL